MFEQIARNIYKDVERQVGKTTYDLSVFTDRDVQGSGSVVYVFKNSLSQVIYVGETGQHMKNRLYADGGGSHNNKEWYKEIRYIDVYESNWSKHERKMIEEAFIFTLKPKYNK